MDDLKRISHNGSHQKSGRFLFDEGKIKWKIPEECQIHDWWSHRRFLFRVNVTECDSLLKGEKREMLKGERKPFREAIWCGKAIWCGENKQFDERKEKMSKGEKMVKNRLRNRK